MRRLGLELVVCIELGFARGINLLLVRACLCPQVTLKMAVARSRKNFWNSGRYLKVATNLPLKPLIPPAVSFEKLFNTFLTVSIVGNIIRLPVPVSGTRGSDNNEGSEGCNDLSCSFTLSVRSSIGAAPSISRAAAPIRP